MAAAAVRMTPGAALVRAILLVLAASVAWAPVPTTASEIQAELPAIAGAAAAAAARGDASRGDGARTGAPSGGGEGAARPRRTQDAADDEVTDFLGSVYMDASVPQYLVSDPIAADTLSDIIEQALAQAIPGVEPSMVEVTSLRSIHQGGGASAPAGRHFSSANDTVVMALYTLTVPEDAFEAHDITSESILAMEDTVSSFIRHQANASLGAEGAISTVALDLPLVDTDHEDWAKDEQATVFRGNYSLETADPLYLLLNSTSKLALVDSIQESLAQTIPGVDDSMVEVLSMYFDSCDDCANGTSVAAQYEIVVPTAVQDVYSITPESIAALDEEMLGSLSSSADAKLGVTGTVLDGWFSAPTIFKPVNLMGEIHLNATDPTHFLDQGKAGELGTIIEESLALIPGVEPHMVTVENISAEGRRRLRDDALPRRLSVGNIVAQYLLEVPAYDLQDVRVTPEYIQSHQEIVVDAIIAKASQKWGNNGSITEVKVGLPVPVQDGSSTTTTSATTTTRTIAVSGTTTPTISFEDPETTFRGGVYMDVADPEYFASNQTAKSTLVDIIERSLAQAIPGLEPSMVSVSSIESIRFHSGASARRLHATAATAAQVANETVLMALYTVDVPADAAATHEITSESIRTREDKVSSFIQQQASVRLGLQGAVLEVGLDWPIIEVDLDDDMTTATVFRGNYSLDAADSLSLILNDTAKSHLLDIIEQSMALVIPGVDRSMVDIRSIHLSQCESCDNGTEVTSQYELVLPEAVQDVYNITPETIFALDFDMFGNVSSMADASLDPNGTVLDGWFSVPIIVSQPVTLFGNVMMNATKPTFFDAAKASELGTIIEESLSQIPGVELRMANVTEISITSGRRLRDGLPRRLGISNIVAQYVLDVPSYVWQDYEITPEYVQEHEGKVSQAIIAKAAQRFGPDGSMNGVELPMPDHTTTTSTTTVPATNKSQAHTHEVHTVVFMVGFVESAYFPWIVFSSAAFLLMCIILMFILCKRRRRRKKAAQDVEDPPLFPGPQAQDPSPRFTSITPRSPDLMMEDGQASERNGRFWNFSNSPKAKLRDPDARPIGEAIVPTEANPSVDITNLRVWLIKVYTRYNPAKLDQVDAKILEYKGREVELIREVSHKYRLHPDHHPRHYARLGQNMCAACM